MGPTTPGDAIVLCAIVGSASAPLEPTYPTQPQNVGRLKARRALSRTPIWGSEPTPYHR